MRSWLKLCLGIAAIVIVNSQSVGAQLTGIFLYDDFDDGNYTSNPTWTMTSNGNGYGDEDWAVRPDPWYDFTSISHHGYGYFMGSNALFGGGLTDEELSISFNTDGTGMLSMSYWLYFAEIFYENSDYFEVLIDNDQIDFVPLDFTGNRSLDLSDYNDGESHDLTMHYYAPYGLACAFDDVKITNTLPQDTLILAVSPLPNENNAPLESDVSVQFDVSMNQSTFNDSTFLLKSGYSGFLDGAISYDVQTHTATLYTDDFVVGDILTSTLTEDIQALDGTPLENSFLWTFTAEAVSGTGEFEVEGPYPTGGFLQNISVADLDGDGDLDLAATKSNTDQVAVLMNNGEGVFGSPTSFAVGDLPWWSTVADLDRDGDIDIVSANGITDNISVLMNNGNGTFASQVTYSTADNPRSVGAGDFDGDGDLDLATANLSGSISFFRNYGNGTFAAHVDYLTGDDPISLYTADLDSDGDLDLVTGHGNNNHPYVSVLMNFGNGTFDIYNTFGVGDFPAVVYAADMDNDRDLDIICGGYAYNSVSVLMNQGFGIFDPYVSYAVEFAPWGIIAADFNADGYMDIAATNQMSNTVSILTNDGDGTFTNDTSYAVGSFPQSLIAGDLDSDGDIDLAVASNQSQNIHVLRNANVPPQVVSTSPDRNELNVTRSTDISVTFDIDMDSSTINSSTFVVNAKTTGLVDGAISYDFSSRTATFNPSVAFQVGEVVTVTLSDDIQSLQGEPLEQDYVWQFTVTATSGIANFVPSGTYTAGAFPAVCFDADYDGDGDIDLAIPNRDANNISFLLNNGDGTFSAGTNLSASLGPDCVFSADFDEDGDNDLAVSRYSADTLYIFLNDGTGAFTLNGGYFVSYLVQQVTGGDYNGDGDLDLAAVSASSYTISILLGNGDGTFASPTTFAIGTEPSSLYAADLDNDYDLDLAVSHWSPGMITVLMNDGGGTFSVDTTITIGTGGVRITAADLDNDGDNDLVAAVHYNAAVAVLLNDGLGGFSAPVEYGVGTGPYCAIASDVDNDGYLDLCVSNAQSDNISVLLNNGDGTFASQLNWAVGEFPHTIVSSDFDGDGSMDLATSNTESANVSILLNIIPYGSIAGAVTDNAISPIEGVIVVAQGTVIEDSTDSNGQYFLDSLTTGSYNIAFSIAGYRDTVITGVAVTTDDTTTLDVTMEELPGSIVGTVTDAGANPIEGVVVGALGTGTEDTTDTNGEYILGSLEVGTYDISFEHIDYRDTVVTGIGVTAGDTTVQDMVMEELPGLLSGTVMDEGSQPVESVYVEINSIVTINSEIVGIPNKSEGNEIAISGLLLEVVDSVYTDSNGYYECSLPGGLYDVAFFHADYDDTVVAGIAITRGDTTILDMQLALSGCEYATGDVNGSGNYNGLDITYGVAYLKGGNAPQCEPCPLCPDWFYCGDVNGSCNYNGLDVTYGVNFLKGIGPDPAACEDCPPIGGIVTVRKWQGSIIPSKKSE